MKHLAAIFILLLFSACATSPTGRSQLMLVSPEQAVTLFPHTNPWDWQATVIDDPKTVNVWCMAGGKIAVIVRCSCSDSSCLTIGTPCMQYADYNNA